MIDYAPYLLKWDEEHGVSYASPCGGCRRYTFLKCITIYKHANCHDVSQFCEDNGILASDNFYDYLISAKSLFYVA